ncbi:MAG: ABC transporter substrate-binding protein [Treponema sp.]
MKRFIVLVSVSALLFSSCVGKKAQNSLVRINISAEPDSLDPWQSAAADTAAIFNNVFEGLLKASPSGGLNPCIAESYSVSEDKLTYEFKLRRNVVFHNGQKLTSKDVLYTYQHLAGLEGVKAVSNKFGSVESIAAPDDYTFQVRLSKPDASFPALNSFAILPEGYENQAEHPIGTGPYKFVSYAAGQKIAFEKNADYYLKDKMPRVDAVEVYIMTNAAAVVSALRSDQLDIAYFINGEDAKLLESEYTVASAPSNMVQIFGLNNAYGPLADLRVRQAINYAVNKKDIIDGVWAGYADELYTNFSPVLKDYYNDSLTGFYAYDIEKAKALLAEAGYADGFELVITVPANYGAHVQTAEILVSQLAKINVRAKLELVEWATWLDQVYTKYQYQSTVISFSGKLEPNDILARYVSTNKRDFIRFTNAEYDALMADALAETDGAKRISMYRECQKLMTENAASVFICDPNRIVAAKKNLRGYTFYPVSFIDFAAWYYD